VWFRNSALALASVLAGLLLVEIATRWLTAPPRYHTALNHLEFDPELGFRQVPGLVIEESDEAGPFRVRLSSDGFRGREIPPDGEDPTRSGSLRIAFLGDSFLVGLAVRDEDLLTTRTERALEAQGRRAEIYNLSSTDYGTGQELLLLRRFAHRIRPDVVVLALYPSNDFANNTIELAGRTTGSPGDYLRPYVFPGDGGDISLTYPHPARAWVRRHSRVFAILEKGLLAFGRSREIDELDPWPARPGLEERLRRGLAPSEELEIHRPGVGDPAWRAAWQTTFRLLRAVRDECQAIGARLLVLVIPRFVQVQQDATSLYTDLLVRQAGARPIDEQLDWNEPERTLARFFRAEGIDARLALDPLREATAAAGVSAYLRDGHLDARGHAVAAREVIDWLSNGGRSDPLTTAGPVSLLPPASAAPTSLDFHTGRHQAFLVLGGWPVYRTLAPGVCGWLIGANARLALPARSADLRVRGRVPSGMALPVRLGVALEGGDRQIVALGREGPFEVRLSHPLAPSLRGYVFVNLFVEPQPSDVQAPSGLLIEEVGFDEPRPAADVSPPCA